MSSRESWMYYYQELVGLDIHQANQACNNLVIICQYGEIQILAECSVNLFNGDTEFLDVMGNHLDWDGVMVFNPEPEVFFEPPEFNLDWMDEIEPSEGSTDIGEEEIMLT